MLWGNKHTACERKQKMIENKACAIKNYTR